MQRRLLHGKIIGFRFRFAHDDGHFEVRLEDEIRLGRFELFPWGFPPCIGSFDLVRMISLFGRSNSSEVEANVDARGEDFV